MLRASEALRSRAEVLVLRCPQPRRHSAVQSRLLARRPALPVDGWGRFGHARHSHFLQPQPHADAIKAIVDAPRGVHLNLIEVSPEAPVTDPAED